MPKSTKKRKKKASATAIDAGAESLTLDSRLTLLDAYATSGKVRIDRPELFVVPDVIPTGFPEIDRQVFGIGGIPRGHVSQLAGEPGAGKSTMALNFMKSAIDKNMVCCYADLEGSFTEDWATRIGCKKGSYRIYRGFDEDGVPKPGPQVLEELLHLLEAGVEFLVVDSLSFIGDDSIAEKDLADRTMHDDLSNAKLKKAWTWKLVSGWKCKTDRYGKAGEKMVNLLSLKPTVLCIDHLSDKIGPTYGRESKDTAGGKKQKYAFRIRLFLERFGMSKDEEFLDEAGRRMYTRAKLTCVKNTFYVGGRTTTMFVNNKNGRWESDPKHILEYAIRSGVLDKESSVMYKWGEEFASDDKLIRKLKMMGFNADETFRGKEAAAKRILTWPQLVDYILSKEE